MLSTFAVRETQSLGQQMLNAPFGINGLKYLQSGDTETLGIDSVDFCPITYIFSFQKYKQFQQKQYSYNLIQLYCNLDKPKDLKDEPFI